MMADPGGRTNTTPLHRAALANDTSEVERLLRGGADANATDRQGFTPLHYAAQEYAVEAARSLVAAGADVNRRNDFGNGPLFAAAFHARGRGEIILLLRSAGADPFAANKSGQTPVGVARLIANYDNAQYFADLD